MSAENVPTVDNTTTEAVTEEVKAEDVKLEDVKTEETEEAADAEFSDEDEEDFDEEDEEPETRAPEEIMKLAKEAVAAANFEEAVELSVRAIRRKLEVSGFDDNSINFSLGPYYLCYGDALLQKEENSNELFNFDAAAEGQTEEELKKAAESTEAAADAAAAVEGDEDDEDNIEDLQLAWETIEFARVCFASGLAAAAPASESEEDAATRVEAARQASFAAMRSADLLLLQEKYEEALVEYNKALEMRIAHNLPATSLTGLYIPIGQLYQSLANKDKARESFSKAIDIITEAMNKEGVEESVKAEQAATIKEIEDYVASLDEKVEEGDVESGEFSNHLETAKQAAAEAAATVRERMRAGQEIEMNEDGAAVLGESKLSGAAAEVVVVEGASTVASTTEEEQEGGEQKKKRRIVIA